MSEAFDYLKEGEQLILNYVVRAIDSSNAISTLILTITITGTNDTPAITVVDVTGAVTEDSTSGSPARLRDSGSLSFTDLDLTDLSTTTSTYISAVASTGASVSSALATALQDLTNTFVISGAGVSNLAQNGTVNWAFSLDNALAQYLAAGETVTATYRITVTDDSTYNAASGNNQINRRTQDVTVTLTGTNDAPLITVAAGNADSAALNETNSGLTAAGTLTVSDVDLTNTVSVAKLSVAATGTTTGLLSTNAQLLAMLTISPAAPTNILDSTETTDQLSWSFSSGSEAFNYLAAGEQLSLTYTLRATD